MKFPLLFSKETASKRIIEIQATELHFYIVQYITIENIRCSMSQWGWESWSLFWFVSTEKEKAWMWAYGSSVCQCAVCLAINTDKDSTMILTLAVTNILQTWERDGSWLYCIDFLREEEHPYSWRYRYAVKWSIPTRRKPIPRATASVYITIEVSKFKPKVW